MRNVTGFVTGGAPVIRMGLIPPFSHYRRTPEWLFLATILLFHRKFPLLALPWRPRPAKPQEKKPAVSRSLLRRLR